MYPKLQDGPCTCNSNPTVSKFSGCKDPNTPVYFNDASDIPNGICVATANGKTTGTSITTCSADADCLEGLSCSGGMCADSSGMIEANRLVTTCVGPKISDKTNPLAGCPYGGTGNAGNILACHKYWIQDKGMAWKRYIQHNPLGQGDSYSWAYDEAVCAIAGSSPAGNPDYPWCTNPSDISEDDVDP